MNEEELQKCLNQQFQMVAEKGVIDGFREALKLVVKDIDSGLTIEQLRERITGKIKESEIIEKTK